MKTFLILILALILGGCAGTSNPALKGHVDDLDSHRRFGVCFGYGCTNYQKTSLTDDEWSHVSAIFKVPATTAEEERVMIAQAIAVIEQYVGPKTGTENDEAGAQIIQFNSKNQMDCIDEAFNSTTYLFLLRKEGLIQLHTLGGHYRRGYKIGRWAHSTATIHENGLPIIVGGIGHYVVDSWFHVNGALPEIIPSSQWMKGWSPTIKRQIYISSAS
jgi:hypothetical protein